MKSCLPQERVGVFMPGLWWSTILRNAGTKSAIQRKKDREYLFTSRIDFLSSPQVSKSQVLMPLLKKEKLHLHCEYIFFLQELTLVLASDPARGRRRHWAWKISKKCIKKSKTFDIFVLTENTHRLHSVCKSTMTRRFQANCKPCQRTNVLLLIFHLNPVLVLSFPLPALLRTEPSFRGLVQMIPG